MQVHRLNLAHETAHLELVVEGVRLLVQQLAHDACADERDRVLLPAAAGAVLELLTCRLLALRQVLAGELSPRALCAAHNGDDGASGLTLSWDAARELRHAETELARARVAAEPTADGS